MPRDERVHKVLVLGSAAIKIGEAGEFDYSGSQAIKALKEENVETVLVNPNIATIQTDRKLADKVYFLPVNPSFVEKVIAKEKPDGILLGFGGQTALNCGLALAAAGILDRHRVRVLGTPVEAIKNTEDRDLFVRKLREIGVKTPRSTAVTTAGDALQAAAAIGYPVMIRSGYSLGGLGSALAADSTVLEEKARIALSHTRQILVEEYLEGWKEIEYEVVRDRKDNCITVCNMENFDPMGIHTGESIVVAPSQTLNNNEYHLLREISIRVIRHIGIVGECNIQFALNPHSDDYRVIEVNARLSRSSALASKATGYPLAFVAAKLALGYSLPELKNSITEVTTACFEPALDYIVVKVPRWDLKKFRLAEKRIGSEMKSVGEVMAIGRTFEETLQKALRMLGTGKNGIVANDTEYAAGDAREELHEPRETRIFAIADAMKHGISVEELHDMTKIDRWFLYKMHNIVEHEKMLARYGIEDVPRDVLLRAKQLGFSDYQLARIMFKDRQHMEEKVMAVRSYRKRLGIVPVVKQIDTLAAEFPAKTNYLYLTYNGTEDDIDFTGSNKIIVLGGGAYRIGSSVEFDWCAVNTILTLRELGYHTIMINYNPETVSTDYDICDKLYFDELTFERVLDIYEKESPLGVIISMGGQIPNNLSLRFLTANVRVLGTAPESIDRAEDRHKFASLLDSLGIDQPQWKELTNIGEAKKFSGAVGYPVLIRPSYVLSGSAMSVAFTEHELERYVEKAAAVSKEHPVVISKFITNAKELEIDAVAKDGTLLVRAITEHIENAGVHSGDATIVFPPKNVYLETANRIGEIAEKISRALRITGPFNIQFIAKDNEIKVIECNLRASRSFPFVSKVSNVNFVELATKAIVGADAEPADYVIRHVGVKAPQFSFSRLKGADPILTVEMSSTGEVACLGDDVQEAFLKSIISAGFVMPKNSVLLGIGGEENRYKLLDSIRILHDRGFSIFATEHTSEFLKKHGIQNTVVGKIHEAGNFNVLDLIEQKKVDLVINIPSEYTPEQLDDEYLIRRRAADFGIPLLTNMQISRFFIDALAKKSMDDLKIKAWDEYT
ncbi:MAG: carbamoyl-phosphate synthase (glutamine-hydrolyzing) large subunit [Candidatus Aenigmarchaeota archaeon]|nr:carbamoyl-phosphate synthase (glutamine-hydrolyzing) large subunit [Candidatus Aenigmarchaeota archaeon]